MVLQFNQHLYEQLAYKEIRDALTDSFMAQPEEFVAHFGCRPEDLSGSMLRDYYPHMLVQNVELKNTNSTFRKKFLSGELFCY